MGTACCGGRQAQVTPDPTPDNAAEASLTPLLLLTRPAPQSRAFADLCRAKGITAEVMISPVLRIVTLPLERPLDGVAALVFTSANGVEALAGQAQLAGRAAWALGGRTADAARAAGMDTREGGGDAASLVAAIRAAGQAGPLLHVRGGHVRGDLAGELTRAGIETAEAVLYDQEAEPLGAAAQAALASSRPVILPLFSPRSAALVAQSAGPARAPLHLIAMSEAVAAAWPGPGRPEVARAPTAEAMAEAVARRAAD